MISPFVSLAASLAPTVFQGILGINQNQQAKDVAPGARPVYEIPTGAKNALNLSRMTAAGNMPGYDQTRENIEAAAASAVLQGSKFGNPAISQAYRGVTSALKDLGVENAGFRERQMNNLINSYQNYAGYQEKAFDINEMQPYEYALQQAQDLKNASNENIYGALGDLSTGIIDTMSAFDMGGEGTERQRRGLNGYKLGKKVALSGDPLQGTVDTGMAKLVQTVASNPQLYASLKSVLGE